MQTLSGIGFVLRSDETLNRGRRLITKFLKDMGAEKSGRARQKHALRFAAMDRRRERLYPGIKLCVPDPVRPLYRQHLCPLCLCFFAQQVRQQTLFIGRR